MWVFRGDCSRFPCCVYTIYTPKNQDLKRSFVCKSPEITNEFLTKYNFWQTMALLLPTILLFYSWVRQVMWVLTSGLAQIGWELPYVLWKVAFKSRDEFDDGSLTAGLLCIFVNGWVLTFWLLMISGVCFVFFFFQHCSSWFTFYWKVMIKRYYNKNTIILYCIYNVISTHNQQVITVLLVKARMAVDSLAVK